MIDSTTFASKQERQAFLREIEQELRHGRAEQALAGVKERLRRLPVPHTRLAALALAAEASGIGVTGWDGLAARFAKLGAKGRPITGLGIDLSSPGHIGEAPDEGGRLAPYIETSYYSDTAFPFSSKDRAGLIEGYSTYGSQWQGNFEDIDNQIGITGLDELYGAVQLAENDGARNWDSDEYDLAAAVSAILVHLAVKAAVETWGLPHPVAVLVGSNEDYPFYDAPVFSIDELNCTFNAAPPPPAPDLVAESPIIPPPEDFRNATAHPSGSSLRRALIGEAAAPTLDTQPSGQRSGLLARLFSRRTPD